MKIFFNPGHKRDFTVVCQFLHPSILRFFEETQNNIFNFKTFLKLAADAFENIDIFNVVS